MSREGLRFGKGGGLKGFDKATVREALSAHAAIGLLAGALLYLVCLTGTIVVFYAEWQRIEQPAAPEMADIAPQAVQRGVDAVLASEKGKPLTTHLFVHMPVPDLPRTTITTDSQAVHLRADGSIAMPEENAWSDFLLILHYTLHLPSTFGMVLVAILGVMIVALAISGVVAHPRIFRDAFRLRARDTGGVGLADWHNRLGVWTLPFVIAIAMTGAMIGLALITGYGLATSFYKGDMEAVYAPIFGGEGKPDKARGPTPDVSAVIRYMQAHHPGERIGYITLHDPLTAGQHVQIMTIHPNRLIFGEYYMFDARGRLESKAGLSDGAMGQQAAASAYNLHFGNYGGLPVKVAYALFGLALSAMTATGVSIWLAKRRRRGIDQPRLTRAWDAVVWGTPVALILTFLVRQWVGNGAPLIATFWGSLAAILLVSPFVGDGRRFARALQWLLGAGVAAGAMGFVAAL
ncbi:MAG TPA: PepSY-associated TM helix domain-containing protein [Sphingobium sp.]